MSPFQDRSKARKNKQKSANFKAKKGHLSISPSQPGKTSRGLVRIIAGTHRGRRLPVLVSEGLRPTSDRVKETLFNWLMTHTTGAKCLDMFAGSGALGIEALSRGAAHVTFIEQEKTVAEQLNNNLVTLREADKAEVVMGNAYSHEFDNAEAYNIVFIDPPFGKEMVEKSINILLSSKILSPNALIYIETAHSDEYAVPSCFSLVKQIKTSQVFAALFELNT